MPSCLTTEKYQYYVDILKEELVPAMGCTEPIAIAYAAAKAREVLGVMPKRCEIAVSGNIIKNAKSVVVPHTGGMKGIEAALLAGIVSNRADARLEVLSKIRDEDIALMQDVRENLPVKVSLAEGTSPFEIIVRAESEESYALVRIADRHTNIVRIEKDGEVLFESEGDALHEVKRRELSVREIIDFADNCVLDDVIPTLKRQIDCNMAIAREGLSGNWGASVGRVYLDSYLPDVSVKAKA
jgi:L-cysteine desulfidase